MDVEEYLRERRALLGMHPTCGMFQPVIDSESATDSEQSTSKSPSFTDDNGLVGIDKRVDASLISLTRVMQYVTNILGIIDEEGHSVNLRRLVDQNRTTMVLEDTRSQFIRDVTNLARFENDRMTDEDIRSRLCFKLMNTCRVREIDFLKYEHEIVKHVIKAEMRERLEMKNENELTVRLRKIRDAERTAMQIADLGSFDFREMRITECRTMQSIEKQLVAYFAFQAKHVIKIQSSWRSCIVRERFKRLLWSVNTIQSFSKTYRYRRMILQTAALAKSKIESDANEKFMRSLLSLDCDYIRTCDSLVEIIEMIDSSEDGVGDFRGLIQSLDNRAPPFMFARRWVH